MATESKGALVEKLIFAAIPIMFSCIVYLMTAISSMSSKINTLENKIAVVVNNENKAIPPQGTTIDMEQIKADASTSRMIIREEAALARAALDKRISILEFRLDNKK